MFLIYMLYSLNLTAIVDKKIEIRNDCCLYKPKHEMIHIQNLEIASLQTLASIIIVQNNIPISNNYQEDCVEHINLIKKLCKPTINILNQPYKAIQKYENNDCIFVRYKPIDNKRFQMSYFQVNPLRCFQYNNNYSADIFYYGFIRTNHRKTLHTLEYQESQSTIVIYYKDATDFLVIQDVVAITLKNTNILKYTTN